MKKITFLLAFMASLTTFAQYENNYLQLTQVNSLFGDARYTGLGGAMSAVGSNFSAVSNNPASVARFIGNEINFGMGLEFAGNTNTYRNNTLRNSTTKLGVNSYGVVLDASKRGSEGGKFWFGFSGKRASDYKNNNVYRAQNINFTQLDAFAAEADGTVDANVTEFFPFTAGLAFETFLINPDTVNFDTYTPAFSNENARIENDENGKRFENSFSFGYNSNNKIYLGVSVSYLTANYSNVYTYFGENTNAETENAQNYNYRYFYNASSTGVNAALGIIYKPSKSLNLGFSYTTPSAWYVNERFSSDLSSEFNDGSEYFQSEFEGIGNYKVISPSKINFSAAVTDQKFGLFSVEATSLNYKKGELRATNDDQEFIDFTNNNRFISSEFRNVWQIKVGYEKPFKNFALRVGYNTVPSAFNNDNEFLSYTTNNISGGFGIFTNFGRLDFSVTSRNNSRTLQPYAQSDIATSKSNQLFFNASVAILKL